MKAKYLPFIVSLLIAAVVSTSVLAAYLGPDRTRTVTHSVCHVKLHQCTSVNGTWKYVTTRESSCGEDKWWLAYPSTELTCNAANAGYEYYSKGDITVTETVTYPPATIAGELLNCNLHNGWCNTSPSLSLSGNEPVVGYQITAIEGTRNGVGFSNSGSTHSISLAQGQNDFTFWALSSWGDSSLMGSLSAKVDTAAPDVNGIANGTAGNHGWYISPVGLSASASDSASGVDGSPVVSQDGGATWVSSLNLGSGIFNVLLRAYDVAGNVATGSLTFHVDTLKPDISASSVGTLGNSGWYVSSVSLSATATDTLSGMDGSPTVSTNGGTTWFPVPLSLNSGVYPNVLFRARDMAGNEGLVASSIKIDTAPPQILLDIGGTAGISGWWVSPVTVSTSAADTPSGVASAEVSSGGLHAPSLTLADGIHTVGMVAEDVAGNVAVGSQKVYVDTTKPVASTTATGVHGDNGWYISSVDLSAFTTDNLSGIASVQHRVDGGEQTSGTSVTIAGDGNHTVEFQVFDLAGNVTANKQTVRVDTVKPSVYISAAGALGDNGWYVSPVDLSATATDATSGVDGAPMVSADGGATWHSVLNLGSGVYPDVLFRVYDIAGNEKVTPYSVKVDTDAPSIFLSENGTMGNGGWYISPPILTASAADSLSGIDATLHRVDGGAWESGASVTIGDGIHVVEFQAFDKAGNETVASQTVWVDTVIPDVSISAAGTPGSNGWYISSVDLSASATDDLSGIGSVQYRIDGGAWSDGGSLTVEDGIREIEFQAFDVAGNETVTSQTVWVDTVKPDIAVSALGTLGSNNWYVSPVDLSATASDATSGVDGSPMVSADGGATWHSSLNLGSGVYPDILFRARDQAGNENILAHPVQVDTNLPSISLSENGTMGEAGWYVSYPTLSASAADETSGVAAIQHRVDGGAWEAGPSVAVGDGTHTVEIQAFDVAGNAQNVSRILRADTVPPMASFSASMRGAVFSGTAYLAGATSDIHSGVASVEVLPDGTGASWLPALYTPTEWGLAWDTSNLPNGDHVLLARARDAAGNVSAPVAVSVVLDNHPPLVSLSSLWPVPESGVVTFQPDVIPLASVKVEVETTHEMLINEQPSAGESRFSASWTTGRAAAPGTYSVVATVCDIYGLCASARGAILVSAVAPIPSVEPGPVEPHPVEPNPVLPPVIEPPAYVPIQINPFPDQPIPAPLPALVVWPLLFVAAILLMYAFLLLSDPRPGALRSLARVIQPYCKGVSNAR